jgi:3-hydroxybutyryl-CoA dehydratase
MITKGQIFREIYDVDDRVYNGFISLFKDNNPLHTDVVYAKQKGFTTKVMHGNILNGFISHFIGECLPTREVMIYSQDIKYSRPVFLSDKLTLHAVVEDFHESVMTAEIKFHFENQDGIKVAKGKISIGLI